MRPSIWENCPPSAAPSYPFSGAEWSFVLDHTSGSHFIYYHPASHRRAVVPQHNRDLPKETLMSLLGEAGFTREDLIDFLTGS
jgi:predicted RNA binding protein YcfA (HicA-like mRNA interferase family)